MTIRGHAQTAALMTIGKPENLMKTPWTLRLSAALLATATTLMSLSALDWIAQWQPTPPQPLASSAAAGKNG